MKKVALVTGLNISDTLKNINQQVIFLSAIPKSLEKEFFFSELHAQWQTCFQAFLSIVQLDGAISLGPKAQNICSQHFLKTVLANIRYCTSL